MLLPNCCRTVLLRLRRGETLTKLDVERDCCAMLLYYEFVKIVDASGQLQLTAEGVRVLGID